MLQKSKSKSIARFKYLVLVPLMLVMLIYVACSDDTDVSSDGPDLKQYSYILRGGDEKSTEEHAVRYEKFLRENPYYVGWSIVDQQKETIEYTIHPKDEDIPEDYAENKFKLPQGGESAFYVKEINTDANTALDNKQINEIIAKEDAAPFAILDYAPVFEDCDHLSSNEERKKCTSDKIQEFVLERFNTSIGEELGLTGVNRIIVVFKINKLGKIVEVTSRAPHPQLEEEAILVISSLPTMISGKQDGKDVSVSYSLPIVFQVGQ